MPKPSFLESVVEFLISYQVALETLMRQSSEQKEGMGSLVKSGRLFEFSEEIESYFMQFFALLRGSERARIEKSISGQITKSKPLTIESVTGTIETTIKNALEIPLRDKTSAEAQELIGSTNALPILFESSLVLTEVMTRFESQINPNAFLERLRVKPNVDPSVELYRIARYLQNHVRLMIKGQAFRIMEVEAYYFHKKHPDPFVHRSEEQAQLGRWYFHKRGTGFIEGNRSGLDITFGENGAFGGFLIRGIGPITGDEENSDGPARVVDRILSILGETKVASVASRLAAGITKEQCPELFLVSDPTLVAGEWCAAPRVGLPLKDSVEYEMQKEFIGKLYRFHICPDQTNNDRSMFFISLLLQGWSGGRARQLTNISEGVCRNAMQSFEKGMALSPDDFKGKDLTLHERISLLGALKKSDPCERVVRADLNADYDGHPHFD